MSKNVLNKTLLSLVTASLLTTSAFADVTTTSKASKTEINLDFSKTTNSEMLFEFKLESSSSSKIQDINLTLKNKDSIEDLSFLKQLVIYHKGTDASDEIFKYELKQVDLNNSENAINISLSEITAEDSLIFKSNDTSDFYIKLGYEKPTANLDSKRVEFNLTNISFVEDYANADSTKVNKSIEKNGTTIIIDTAIPTFTTSSKSSDIITVTFSEDITAITKSDLEKAKSNFTVTDSYNQNYEIVDVNSSGNTLDLNVSSLVNNIFTGDLFLNYTTGFISDKAGNLVENLVENNVSRVVKDDTSPIIDKVELSFEDTKQIKVSFSEVLKDFTYFFKKETGETNLEINKTKTDETGDSLKAVSVTSTIVPQTDKLAAYTVLNIELNESVDSSTVTVQAVVKKTKDNNITDFVGRNRVTEDDKTSEEGDLSSLNNLKDFSWNLLSIPSDKMTTSKKMLASGDIQTIWGYDFNTSEDKRWEKFPKRLDAGKGYWVRTYKATDLTAVKTTGYSAKVVTDKDSIKNAPHNEWALIGINTMSVQDARSQVADGCNGVSIFDYNRTAQKWNVDETISDHSGIWVKQENCDK